MCDECNRERGAQAHGDQQASINKSTLGGAGQSGVGMSPIELMKRCYREEILARIGELKTLLYRMNSIRGGGPYSDEAHKKLDEAQMWALRAYNLD